MVVRWWLEQKSKGPTNTSNAMVHHTSSYSRDACIRATRQPHSY